MIISTVKVAFNKNRNTFALGRKAEDIDLIGIQFGRFHSGKMKMITTDHFSYFRM